MKILVIAGSPRPNGNTSYLVRSILAGAHEAEPEASVDEVVLNRLDFTDCQACLRCRGDSATRCATMDGLTDVLDGMLHSDRWVLATPIYMGHVTGKFKMFLDRTFGFSGPNETKRIPPGKKAVIAITQGWNQEDRYDSVTGYIRDSLQQKGVEAKTIALGGRLSWEPARGLSPEEDQKARDLGKWLASTAV